MLYKLVYIIYHWLRIVWHNTPVFICQWNKTLLKQAAICKGKLCINQTSKYQGLYIILQNTGVLYLSRMFFRKFCPPGIRFWTFPPKLYLLALIIEGLRAKRAYIEIWPIFIFCRIKLIFGRRTWFDMKSIVPQLYRPICASFSRNNVCRKTQFCVKRHLNERIFRRQILTRRELKRLLLAALTACFL